ncbi:MAG TPA: hypothetical protein VKN99_27705 [Polyangia bacterium]|nr:hypothetical protein [Polyangia bacterium]
MRAMQADGFRIERADAIGFMKPQKIGSKEPDVIGLRTADGLYAFGEAKTGEGDIDTEHTRTQLTEFSGRRMSGSGVQCPLYVAVPQKCVDELATLLRELGLVHMPHIRVIPFEWDDPVHPRK